MKPKATRWILRMKSNRPGMKPRKTRWSSSIIQEHEKSSNTIEGLVKTIIYLCGRSTVREIPGHYSVTQSKSKLTYVVDSIEPSEHVTTTQLGKYLEKEKKLLKRTYRVIQ